MRPRFQGCSSATGKVDLYQEFSWSYPDSTNTWILFASVLLPWHSGLCVYVHAHVSCETQGPILGIEQVQPRDLRV